MKSFYILLFCTILSCYTTKTTTFDTSTLNTSQVKIDDITQSKPGKCYGKMIGLDGKSSFYQIICESQKHLFDTARACLIKLGYQLINENNFKTEEGNAIVDFQKKNNLAYGSLDEATIYLLLKQAKAKEINMQH
jgi:hypothetical protein